MMFSDLAQEYAGMRLVNSYTQQQVLTIAKLFVKRSAVLRTSEINRLALMRFKNESLKEIQPVTYNGYLKYLRLIASYGVEVGYLTSNPFEELKLIPVGTIPPKTIELEDIGVLDYALMLEEELYQTGWFWAAVLRCLYYTGMRRRQLVNLRLDDLDFNRETIRLSYQGSKTRREWTVPMHSGLKETLQLLIRKTELRRGKKLLRRDYLFRAFDLFPRFKKDPQGRMPPEAITNYFKRLSKKFDIRVGAHRFRHTFATALCNPEDDTPPDVFAVQQLLGHTDLKTTRIYVQPRVNHLGRVVNRLGKLGRKEDRSGKKIWIA
ncbi:MAG: hypothetical protein B0W54_07715 [Cellvibrio sp. 79]|uniref:tyrosine-type recombinase/integrase n=1 Tax=Cellvibrio sp. KY-GH-1 TaxID=2303332 RepID=UPI000D4618B0|nr:site-specific integrase [Cellvibrio sp. KY-GH-1]PUA30373.1 MAG: hypothetical protein B0W54_07715 [Cellvibrio sp. 79]QEY15983.1 site-specific integrase [Cellvibrio sp. KY-GH-1]